MSLFTTALVLSGLAASAPSDMTSMDALWGGDDFISIATGEEKPVTLSPVVATVITREDIQRIGALDIDEALSLVPGLHPQYRFENTQYIIRGVRSRFTSETRLMVDGISYNDATFGNQRNFLADLPIDLVERIEVIRGPISALHGVDAFSGVINIVTRRPTSVDSVEAHLKAGEFDTSHGHVLVPFELGGWKAHASAYYFKSDGHEPLILRDEQTQFDLIFGTSASLAPRGAFTERERWRVAVDLEGENTRLKFGYRGHLYQTGAGLTGALDPFGESDSRQWNIDFDHVNTEWIDGWRVQLKGNIVDYDTRSRDITLFPPGAFGGLFPDGVKESPSFAERDTRAEMSFVRTSSVDHTTTLGFGFEHFEITGVTDPRNFIFVEAFPGGPQVPFPTGVTAPLPDDEEFLPEESRTDAYVFVQDVWNFRPGWELTLGGRFDAHSDVKDVFSPRAALVWEARPDLRVKFLAGQGFRAPSFLAQYGSQNPGLSGNPDLKPVTITSFDIAAEWRPRPNTRVAANVFIHEIEDAINSTAGPLGVILDNVDEVDGQGIELEVGTKLGELDLAANYSYQDSEDAATNVTVPVSPKSLGMLLLSYPITEDHRLTAKANYVGRAEGTEGVIPQADSFTFLDLTWNWEPRDGWAVGASLRNATDESGNVVGTFSVPDGIPLAERNLLLSFSVSF